MEAVCIIAEKPDQGSRLAAPYPSEKKQGYIYIKPTTDFPGGAYVTWAVGHLCELVPPETYKTEWKKWTLQTLPMIPEQFQYQVSKSKWKQFKIIKEILQKKDVASIIHAGDAGREGELIVRTIINQTGCKKPMQRLWISSLTEKAVKEGFKSLKSERDTRDLYYEAYARSCADWVVGINASRAYTLLFKQKGIQDVFSAGRVQTPTLALVVKREKEISNFKSEPFWEVKGTFDYNGQKVIGKWIKDDQTRIDNPEMAHAIATFCKDKTCQASEVNKERKQYKPPYLYQLSSLQSAANKKYKYSPKKTLDIAQKLYTKGMISYPRSDSSFVTSEEAAEFPSILSKLQKQDAYKDFFPLKKQSIMNDKRYVNASKVSDHYAIIPTEQVPKIDKLSGEESKIYDLIARSLLAAHEDVAIVDYTTLMTLVDNRAAFISKGQVKVQEGWHRVISSSQKDEELPPIEKGQAGTVLSAGVIEGKTQPPKRFTEGQLITMMKTAGKHLEDESLEKVLKDTEGLGTEATRAGIITMLKDRKYIEVVKNQVSATDKGILLIDSIGEAVLASPEMTAKWEQRLKEIGSGSASPQVFMESVKKLAAKLTEDAIRSSDSWDIKGITIEPSTTSKKALGKKVGTCPLCGSDVIDKGKLYGCSGYAKNKCPFTISKRILGKPVSQTNAKKILKDGKSATIKGLKGKKGPFDAALVWNASEKKLTFEFDKK
ncbi:DNA topoisomerase III [Guptibacillus algicola]|uniref:DNA topoisomerase III n=1 Tax=Guptibacillus algicola TaxID=225844 RepID=UPI001CD2D66A|nr:DNA topoisomerase III [Alkalihalobacillus algicola]MCA0988261.1 DNA topoisomerase III [Alkalihalobacillus algicola]